MEYLKLLHTNRNLRNLAQFAEFYNIAISEKFTIDNFFDYNRKYIFDQLSISERIALMKELGKDTISAEDLKSNMTLPCPCFLYVEKKYVTYNLHVRNNNFQIPTVSTIAFQNEQIQEILQDVKLSLGESYQKTVPGCRVLGWFKALHYYNKERGTSNNIDNIYNSSTNFIDISPYIISLNTTVNAAGGNFSFTLPHIPLYTSWLKSESEPSILNTIGNVNREGVMNPNQGAKFLTSEEEKDLYVKSPLHQQDYFNWLIQRNDLLFISFNAMEEIVDDNLANHSYDMIALVDTVSIAKDANGNVTVSVSGRDLMKLITDDSRLFFPNSTARGTNAVFDNTEAVLRGGDLDQVYEVNGKMAKNDRGNLPLIDGTLQVFALEPNDFSIDYVIKAVISKLANMKIVPEYLFTSWGDKRTKFADFKPIVEPTEEGTKKTTV